jgi:hypothetical protein
VNGLTVIALMIMAAVLAWGVTMAYAAVLLSRYRAEMTRRETQMAREIQHWREQAARARSHAAQVTRDAENWAAGLKQGRDDVISVMPLLIAAREAGEDDAGVERDTA